MITLSIVIPVFNSEQTIGQLCTKLLELYSGKYQLDIVLVNDGSRDGSDSVCRKLHEDNPTTITYVKLSRNFGEHNAVIAGLNHVIGDFCVIMDDDLQNPPSEVEKLVDEIKTGYDVVYASYASKRDSWFRNLGSRLNDKMATLILRKPADLYLSSFKIINRFLAKEIVKYTGPDPYIDAIILRATDNIGKIRLEHRRRDHSKSGYTFGKLISLWGNMIVSFSLVPLRVIGVVGMLLTMWGTIYGIYKALDSGVWGKLTDYETMMSANIFFRGMVLIAVSLLGEYVGRIYLSLNKDPQFIVRERLASLAKRGQVTYMSDFKVKDGQNESPRKN